MSGLAVFAHWLESPYEDIPSEPMFNVIQNDKGFKNGSTVGAKTLQETYGISAPPYPSLDDWKKDQAVLNRASEKVLFKIVAAIQSLGPASNRSDVASKLFLIRDVSHQAAELIRTHFQGMVPVDPTRCRTAAKEMIWQNHL